MTRSSRFPHGWWIAPAVFGGMIIGASLAVMAFAQDSHRWTPDTFIRIQPTIQPGAIAEVVFQNHEIHQLQREDFTLSLDGLTVSVVFEMNVAGADDRYTVIPPEGFIAWPESLTVPENGAGVIYVVEDAIG